MQNNAVISDTSRRTALAEVDNAKFSWFHVKVCLVAGVGFFTDAYDILAINLAAITLGGKLIPNQDLGPIGTLVSQPTNGRLADLVDRKKMYGVELIVTIIAIFAQALPGQSPSVRIISALVVLRFIVVRTRSAQ